VAPGTQLPPNLVSLRVGAQRYAVFPHSGHVSTVRDTFMAIFNEWLPRKQHQADEVPVFERYDGRFDPRTGMGGFEIWVPLKA
jgi:AraC family transcriptional regulator